MNCTLFSFPLLFLNISLSIVMIVSPRAEANERLPGVQPILKQRYTKPSAQKSFVQKSSDQLVNSRIVGGGDLKSG